MPRFRDRVRDTTTSTGTGDITLSGTAAAACQTFANAYATGDRFNYAIVAQSGNEWETGTGYLSASTTLVRDVVEDGSSGLATAVNFSAGTKDVFVTIGADWVETTNSGAILHRITGMAMP